MGYEFELKHITGRDVASVDIRTAPIEINGFAWLKTNKTFNRFPEDRLHLLRKDLHGLQTNTSGGMVRFRTDSDLIGAEVVLTEYINMQHMARTGSNGVDIYLGVGADARFMRVIYPGDAAAYEGYYKLPSETPGEIRQWTLHMPLYDGVASMKILLRPGAKLLPPIPFAIPKPILFYGSSITQGGCASRPGNNYTTIIARTLDAEQINLGFSGNALGDPEVASMIAELDLSAFIMDYDYNAPSVDYLAKTHKPFYDAIRKARPDLPIVLSSKPDFEMDVQLNSERRRVILDTFDQAISAGDKNVWFIDGERMFGTEGRDACTVDGTHPNDLGFWRMAQYMLPTIRKALGIGF
jgi:hypothetical protein